MRRPIRAAAASVGVFLAVAAACAPSAWAGPLITSFQAGVLNTLYTSTNVPSSPPQSSYATQAASHPVEAVTNFTFDTGIGAPDNVRVDLPAGMSVNPQAIPQCSQASFPNCPSDTQVGQVTVKIVNIPLLGSATATSAVYNMVPPAGYPGEFSFNTTIAAIINVRTDLLAGVRWYPSNGQSGDYGEYFTISGISNLLGSALQTSTMIFWGAPEEHNGGGATDNWFLTNPSACAGTQTTYIWGQTYNSATGNSSYTTPVGAGGCSSVPFNPTISLSPTSTQRDSAVGATIDVHVPQSLDPSKISNSTLDNASVTLPAGLTLNPAGAATLSTCTDAQFGQGTNGAIGCPAGSVVGSAEIDTPVLSGPLTGSIYLGAPLPGNTYRIFVDAANNSAGVDVRLTGTITPDPNTGQVTTTFDGDPQVPFSDLKLTFSSGSKSLLATPLACGMATTTSSLTPYSGNAAATPSSSFTVDANGSGGSCPSTTPFTPSVSATISNTTAGAYTNLNLSVTRAPGQSTLGGVTMNLPAGLLASLPSVPQCSDSAAAAGTCPAASQIGTTTVGVGAGNTPLSLSGTVSLTGPYDGAPYGLSIAVPAVDGPYNLGMVVVRAAVNVNTVTGALSITTDPLPTIVGGVPLRMRSLAVSINRANFMFTPTSCGPVTIGGEVSATTSQSVDFASPATITGCNLLSFSPSLTATPTTTMIDSPTGLTVDVHVPQPTGGPTAPDLQSAVVSLPAGLTLDPSAAVGLQGCTDAQLGQGTSNAVGCPSASVVGSVEIDTPLLTSPLTGSVYVGAPTAGQPYRLFLHASGGNIDVRLVGDIAADPSTGQLTVTFSSLPQLPFSDLVMKLDGGSNAVLAQSATCGTATVSSVLLPVSSTTASTPSSSFVVDGDGSGGACRASIPFSPGFSLTAPDATAGAVDPITLSLTSSDGQQNISGLDLTLPPGLMGLVGSVPQCGDADAAAGACDASTRIGTATVTAGVGTAPLSLSGPMYLTGPYEGKPFGLSIVVPAIAGPYDLGTVVVRAAIAVDPNDGHLTITSDAIPTILQGIPLRLKGIALTIDRAGFMVNPTSCATATLGATVLGNVGASVGVSTGLTPTGCGSLPFSPTATATASGGKDDPGGAGLDIVITQPSGQANLRSVTVALPSELAARTATLAQACMAATYAAGPTGCPVGSLVGTATAVTPALPDQLSGAVYLVSHGGASLPTMETTIAADGVSINLHGQIAIGATGLSATFSGIPDVPISRFEMNLPTGPHSALAATGALCPAKSLQATFTAQSGATRQSAVPIGAPGCEIAGAGDNARGGKASGPARWLHIVVVRVRHLHHHALRVELRLPSPGHVTLSSPLIHTVSADARRHGRFVWLKVRLDARGLAQLQRADTHRVKRADRRDAHAGRARARRRAVATLPLRIRASFTEHLSTAHKSVRHDRRHATRARSHHAAQKAAARHAAKHRKRAHAKARKPRRPRSGWTWIRLRFR